jgi:hypothetical protein
LAKLAAVVPMIGVSLVHDFLVEPAGGGNALTRVAVASAVHLAGGYGAPQAFAR